MAISYINQVSAGANTATMPTHQIGDLLIVVAYRNATTAPTLGSGFTNLSNQSGNSNSYRIGYKFATATNDAFGTWTNANTVHGIIYRGVGSIGTVGGATKAASTTAKIPTLSLANASGSSWVVAFAGSRQTTSQGTPLAGATTLRSTQTGTTAYSIVADTNGGVASFAATTSANGSSVVSSGASFELIPTPKMEKLIDNFNDNSLDAAKWSSWGGGNVVETGGQLVVTVPTTTSNYYGLESVLKYDLTSSYMLIRMVSDTNSSAVPIEAEPLQFINSTGNRVLFVIANSTLHAYQEVASSLTLVSSVTYNSTNHQWLRIRESGGTTYWDTAPDSGTNQPGTWTNLTSTANPIPLHWGYVNVDAGAYNTSHTGAVVTYDDFNVFTLTKTQTSIARIANIVTKTQSSVARIAKVTTKTQSSIARVSNTRTRTQTSTARVARSVTKTQTSTARIQRLLTKLQTATARIQHILTKTQGAVAHIANRFTKTQGSIARIEVKPTYTQTAKAAIVQDCTKTQTAKAYLAITVTKTQTATARIGILYSGGTEGGGDEKYDITSTPGGTIIAGSPIDGDQIYNPETIPTGDYTTQTTDQSNIYGTE